MKRVIFLTAITAFLTACGGSDKPADNPYATKDAPATSSSGTTANGNPSYDPERGEGKFKTVDIGAKLDGSMADNGKKAYDVKCNSCHKLTDEKLVGPGWKGVTGRHKAEWIMNFMTNTDKMLDKDPKAQAMLEICLVRMPNQNLSDEEARALYEFMRKNDGIK